MLPVLLQFNNVVELNMHILASKYSEAQEGKKSIHCKIYLSKKKNNKKLQIVLFTLYSYCLREGNTLPN